MKDATDSADKLPTAINRLAGRVLPDPGLRSRSHMNAGKIK
jgi:hypothetical protein